MKLNKRKCANCGEVFQKEKPLQQVCSYICGIAKAKTEREKKEKREWQKEKKVRNDKLKTKSDYEKELQIVFNEFIRIRDVGQPCISCGASYGMYKVHAGHYYPAGSYKNLRFHEFNVHNQCDQCNLHLHGNLIAYTERLPLRIGKHSFEQLQRLKNDPRRYSIPELIELKVIYKDKIRKLK